MLEALTGSGRTRPRRAAATRRAGFVRLPALPLTAIVAVLFAVSGGLLWTLGLNYEGLTGSPASKIHPSTYMMVALFGVTLLTSGNPVARVARMTERRPCAVFLLLTTLAIFVSIAARGAQGLAGAVDTYVGASLIVLLMADADEPAMRQIEAVVHVLMTVNALMALVEFATGQPLFPFRFDGALFETDRRASALQGHPLANATVTACYVLALIGGGRLSALGRLRLPLIGLQMAALVAFGGRIGLLVAVALGAWQGIVQTIRLLGRRRVSLLGAAGAFALLALVPIALAAMASGGFFGAMVSRFQADGGSAYARVQMFDLVAQIPFRELLIGPNPAFVDSIRRVKGLEWGIENPIVRTVIYHGIVLTTLLTVAVALYLYELARVTTRGMLVPLLGFVIIINTSESIGGKTTILTKFAVIVLCLFRPAPTASALRGGAVGGRARRDDGS